MSLTASPTLREINQREGDGIVVTLLWERESNRTFVQVEDSRTGLATQFEVTAESAHDAFLHPFAYS